MLHKINRRVVFCIGCYKANRILAHYADFNAFVTIVIFRAHVMTVYYLCKYGLSFGFHQLINSVGLAVFSINYANSTMIC